MQNAPLPALRLVSPADEPFLEALFCELHRAEFTPLNLPEAELAGLLRMQARAQRMGYAGDYPGALNRMIVNPEDAGESAIGRLLVDFGPTEIQLVDIALLPGWQGRGIGTALLRMLIEQAREAGLPLRLSVRPGNRAFNLYTRLGFCLVSGGVQFQMELLPEGAPKGAEGRPPSSLPPSAEEAYEAHRLPTGREFESMLGERFSIEEEGVELPGLLLAAFHRQGPATRDCFSLIFHGPLEPVLPQRIYRLGGGPLDEADRQKQSRVYDLFLVPIGPERDNMRYEAVFNN